MTTDLNPSSSPSLISFLTTYLGSSFCGWKENRAAWFLQFSLLIACYLCNRSYSLTFAGKWLNDPFAVTGVLWLIKQFIPVYFLRRNVELLFFPPLRLDATSQFLTRVKLLEQLDVFAVGSVGMFRRRELRLFRGRQGVRAATFPGDACVGWLGEMTLRLVLCYKTATPSA